MTPYLTCKCGVLMPSPQVVNHQHQCCCGRVWLAIQTDDGRLVWLLVGIELE